MIEYNAVKLLAIVILKLTEANTLFIFKKTCINNFMEIYTQLYSTLDHNGKKVLCDLFKWAELTLSSDRYSQFSQDLDEAMKFIRENGQLSAQEIYSEVSDTNNNPIQIGLRYVWNDQKNPHPNYTYWDNEFANDPKVTYRPLVRES